MQSTDEPLCEAACARITESRQLRQAQEHVARFARGPTAIQELPLTAAAGRILASEIDLMTMPGHEEGVLAAGSKLDWRVLPLLHASGRATVPVRAPVRCGIVVVSKQDAQAAALLVQAAFEKMGGQAFLAWTDGASPQQTSALQMFSKFCDLILVVGTPACSSAALCKPRIFTVAGSVSVDLPADPQAALCSFVSFVVPLVRQLQGRSMLPAAVRSAADESAVPMTGEMVWATARGEGANLRVRASPPAPGQALLGLAEVSGIAWKAEDLAARREGVVAFLPFQEWLD